MARIAHATAAPPAMSSFIRSMPSAGLIEMPPVSNVMPLPTSPSTGSGGRAGRIVSKHHQPRRLAAAARDAEQQAHPELRDAIFVEDLDLDAALGGDRRSRAGRTRAASACCPARWRARARDCCIRRAAGRGRRPLARAGQDVAAPDRASPRSTRARRRRRVAGLVDADVEFRQRQPFGDRLRELGDVSAAAQRRIRRVPRDDSRTEMPAAAASCRASSLR